LSAASVARASGESLSPLLASSSSPAALPDRSGSGNSTSNATSRAWWRSNSVVVSFASVSRGHGQRPTRAMLASSMSTIAICGSVSSRWLSARRASYAIASSFARTGTRSAPNSVATIASATIESPTAHRGAAAMRCANRAASGRANAR
jgi:hypothetical protein